MPESDREVPDACVTHFEIGRKRRNAGGGHGFVASDPRPLMESHRKGKETNRKNYVFFTSSHISSICSMERAFISFPPARAFSSNRENLSMNFSTAP